MHLQPLYRPILKRALSIVWKHKFLWFFGFFAALLGGSGEIDILIGGARNINWGAGFNNIFGQIAEGGGLAEFFRDLGIRWASIPGAGLGVIGVLILVLVILIWLFIVSQISLIDSAARIEKREVTNGKIRHLVGKKYFWKILGLNIINKVIIFGLLFLLSLPFLIALYEDGGNEIVRIVLMIIAYVILVPLAIIVSFVTRYASCYIILAQEKVWTGINKGIKLFLGNWLVSLEMAIILFVLNILVGLGMALVTLIIAFPFLVVTEIFINIGSSVGSWVTMIGGLILVLGVLAIFGAIFVGFTYSCWTLLFLKLDDEGRVWSRVVRFVANIGKGRI